MKTTLKTALITFFAGILLVASLPLSATLASARGYNDGGDGSQSTSISQTAKQIWSGLWNGAALQTSPQPESRPAGSTDTGTTAAQPAPGPPASQTGANRYVALGDSVAAGAGLPLVPNPTSSDRSCRRSLEAYPHIVAQQRRMVLNHVACSGAKATNLLLWQGVQDQPNPNRQISYIFANGVPELVTITAGANDMYWSEYVAKCYRQGATCGPETRSSAANGGADYDTLTTDYLLSLLRGKWELFFTELEIRSSGQPPTVVVTGYYDPFSPQCLELAPDRITQAELDWVSGRVDALNDTLQSAVSGRSYVRFAPVDFSGHDVCSTDSWVQGLDNRNGSAPIHPTAEGQRVIADAVLQAL